MRLKNKVSPVQLCRESKNKPSPLKFKHIFGEVIHDFVISGNALIGLRLRRSVQGSVILFSKPQAV